MAFDFNPTEGFQNTASFPNPSTEPEARTQVQSLLNQLRDALNSTETTLQTGIDTRATKTELQGVVLGQITDGSLTDVKLSDDAGQIKDRVSTLTDFAATKGQPNGLTSLDAGGITPRSQLPPIPGQATTFLRAYADGVHAVTFIDITGKGMLKGTYFDPNIFSAGYATLHIEVDGTSVYSETNGGVASVWNLNFNSHLKIYITVTTTGTGTSYPTIISYELY